MFLFVNWVRTLPPLQEVFALAGMLAFYACLVIIGVRSIRKRFPTAFAGVSPIIIGPLGTIFGLTAAFLCADVWSNQSAALQAVSDEAQVLSRIWTAAEALDPATAGKVQAGVSAYADHIVNKEWPLLRQMSDPYNPVSQQARGMLHDIIFQATRPRAEGAFAGSAALRIEELVGQAFSHHTHRLVIAMNHVGFIKLYLPLFLGLMLILLVAVMHSAELRLLCVMTVSATLVVALVLCGVVANNAPFENGWLKVDAAIFYNIKRDLASRPGGP
ncbi:hypothetical protein ABLE91_11240 [Aquabacter sp. CN5-332]|uniref:bestrophin-like domain n=1 Tax=Aquabacter sp. CN5-332 TaxID=3156608 RepID=UPI0032B36FC6